ncbi:hypothetical protein PoB_001593900 [Plakobranchus ocellatus]|uniref:Uncharacterized protein n=1 Tax=Plakobranchus ocellatus TaxID=259542 RepID=A0AAV3Z4Y9_9GAST|nr:hypothetical protein PoB_001593900 [Plakobranchus ocellatus]
MKQRKFRSSSTQNSLRQEPACARSLALQDKQGFNLFILQCPTAPVKRHASSFSTRLIDESMCLRAIPAPSPDNGGKDFVFRPWHQ